MFAFAILDMRPRPGGEPRVFLARDRLGIKPLYYAFADGALLFASEVRALLASGRVARRLSETALDSYLLFGSLAEPITLIEGVLSIPPGRSMSFPGTLPARWPQPQAYWRYGQAARGELKSHTRDLGAAARELRPVLEDAVRSHLVADVPLGVFLSSGMDSNAIVALASRWQQDLHTFTVAFSEETFSEAALARKTAKRFRTRHDELLITGEDMLARLEQAVAALDQPTMDGINTYFVSWAARQVGLKVALSGLGGDEVFGGYSTFVATPRASRLSAAARHLPRLGRAVAATVLPFLGQISRQPDAARKLAAIWREPDALPHPYFFVRALFTPGQIAALRGGRPLPQSQGSPWWRWLEETTQQARGLDPFAGVSCLEARTYLVNTLLRDTDSVSMSHSLEVRVPLLDHRLAEFVAQLPAPARQRPGVPKALLVEALGDLLPPEIVRQPKRTFTFPWEHWLRGALRARVEAALSELSPTLQPFLDGNMVRRVWQDFLSGRTSWSRPWSLYVLNEWVQRHVAGDNSQLERPGQAVAAIGSTGSSAFTAGVESKGS
jgi:asparagine synthase (glutamine-hydrolysing)